MGLVIDKMMLHVNRGVIETNVMKDIVSSGFTKSQIIQKYGQEIYDEFVDKASFTVGAFGLQNKVNKTFRK